MCSGSKGNNQNQKFPDRKVVVESNSSGRQWELNDPRTYPEKMFKIGFSFTFILFLLMVFVGGLPAGPPGFRSIGPYAAYYVAEIVLGLFVLFIGFAIQVYQSGYSMRVMGEYVMPMISVLTLIFLGFVVFGGIGLIGLPVGNAYSGGEGLLFVTVLFIANDVANFVFKLAVGNYVFDHRS